MEAMTLRRKMKQCKLELCERKKKNSAFLTWGKYSDPDLGGISIGKSDLDRHQLDPDPQLWGNNGEYRRKKTQKPDPDRSAHLPH